MRYNGGLRIVTLVIKAQAEPSTRGPVCPMLLAEEKWRMTGTGGVATLYTVGLCMHSGRPAPGAGYGYKYLSK